MFSESVPEIYNGLLMDDRSSRSIQCVFGQEHQPRPFNKHLVLRESYQGVAAIAEQSGQAEPARGCNFNGL